MAAPQNLYDFQRIGVPTNQLNNSWSVSPCNLTMQMRRKPLFADKYKVIDDYGDGKKPDGA